MYWLYLFISRVVRAAKVLIVLARDKDLRRRLPWAYIRRRLGHDPICLLQWAGIVAALVTYPLGMTWARGSVGRSVCVGASMIVFVLAVVGPGLIQWLPIVWTRMRHARK